MLGKNQVKSLKGLHQLEKLDVLDLHGNQVSRLEGLYGLKFLRILNLAENNIASVGDVSHLTYLTELNLRHNRLTSLHGADEDGGPPLIHHLPPNVTRLYLSSNRINGFDSLLPIQGLLQLSEVALDGNPVASVAGQQMVYRQKILSMCHNLKTLDVRSITEEERRHVRASLARKEAKAQKVAAIELIRETWEQQLRDGGDGKAEAAAAKPPVPGAAAARRPSSAPAQRRGSTSSRYGAKAGGAARVSQERSSTGYIDQDSNGAVCIYGEALGSLGQAAFLTVNKLTLRYIHHKRIAAHMHLLARIPALTTLVLEDNNLASLSDINALAQVPTLKHLTIGAGNPVAGLVLFHPYTVMALPALEYLNGEEITDGERYLTSNTMQPMISLLEKAKGIKAPKNGKRKGSKAALTPPLSFALGPAKPKGLSKGLLASQANSAKELTDALLRDVRVSSERSQYLKDAWPSLIHQIIHEGGASAEREAAAPPKPY